MDDIKDRDPRFSHLEKKVGIFVLVVIVGLLVVIFFVGREQDLFSPKYTLYTISESGAGFIRGMPVKLSGFKIGRVKKLSLDEIARVRVAIEVNKKYQKWIRRGSVARLFKEGFIGEWVLEIEAGELSQPVLQDGETLPLEKAGGIEELVKKAKPVIIEVKEIIDYINDPEGDLKTSLKNIRALSLELEETGREAKHTIVGVRETVGEANSLLSSLNEKGPKVVDKVDLLLGESVKVLANVETFSAKLPAITEKTEEILDNMGVLSEALAVEGSKIEELISDTGDVLRDSKELLEGITEGWPVRLMMPEKEGLRLIPLDGSETGGE
ncbi:MAG: MlaD family protein [Thermodesulfobacteriota bacterium]